MSDYVTLDGKCVWCNKEVFISVKRVDFEEQKKSKAFVKDAYPYLSKDDREFLISRICGSCFDTFFKEQKGKQ